jgi:hypothetical protein
MQNSKHNTTYKAKVLEILEDGSAILELPEDLCEQMGWKEGTKIDISNDDKGNILLKEIKDV